MRNLDSTNAHIILTQTLKLGDMLWVSFIKQLFAVLPKLRQKVREKLRFECPVLVTSTPSCIEFYLSLLDIVIGNCMFQFPKPTHTLVISITNSGKV